MLALLLTLLSFQAPAPAGKTLFEHRCGGCHALDRDKEGPRLGGVFGRRAGTVPSFGYSDALRKSKIVWNAVTLEQWLTDPAQAVPGNDMAFRLDIPAERREIIAFLQSSAQPATRAGIVRVKHSKAGK